METVPAALRKWFIVHFVADLAVAVPLFVAPQLLALLGWRAVDPIATRLVCAALFAIGIGSWIDRNAPAEVFRSMLNLKVIWSSAALVGLIWSQLTGGPPLGWAVVAIFAVFNLVWLRYRLLLRRRSDRG